MTSHSPHPAPEEHAAYTSHHLPNAIPNGPHCTEQCSPSFHFQTGMRAAKRHERKAPTGDFRRKERSDPPEQEITGAAPFSGNARPGKCFSRRNRENQTRASATRPTRTKKERSPRAEEEGEVLPLAFPPIPKKTDIRQQEVHPIIPEGPSPLQRTGGVG